MGAQGTDFHQMKSRKFQAHRDEEEGDEGQDEEQDGSHPLQSQRQEQQPRKIITDVFKKNLAAKNVLGYKESTSGVVIANGSYPTTTADTTTTGNKDKSSGLFATSSKSKVVIARGSWAIPSDKSSKNQKTV
ncbi:hypothetical protein B0H65DRAFT_549339 [Neurospora tetraspora]|uniref:Uncharacterized protein n=1 Tax=Neurospora tetraspora TaxID=94610 RepID=A0AAE0JGF4_9PEZI|nr:hypothetical protein B0H65DRAFT_549339 [Neurospora tetraspora]